MRKRYFLEQTDEKTFGFDFSFISQDSLSTRTENRMETLNGEAFFKGRSFAAKIRGPLVGPLLVYSETGFFLIKWIGENQGQRSVGVDNVSVPGDEVLV
ncbi:MAG: hypothetical protein ACPLPW_08360, partial [bacterium]